MEKYKKICQITSVFISVWVLIFCWIDWAVAEVSLKGLGEACNNEDQKIKDKSGQTAWDKCKVRYSFHEVLGKVYYCSDVGSTGFIPEENGSTYTYSRFLKTHFKLQFREVNYSSETIVGLWIAEEGKDKFGGWCEQDLLTTKPIISCQNKPHIMWIFNPTTGKYTNSNLSGFAGDVRERGIFQKYVMLSIGQCDKFK